jgi:transcriptional regulator with XRE-family HTH domain
MNLAQLHERLRLEVIRLIERGTLSGSLLARQTGYRQSHISNFLRRKRTLSMRAFDRLLAVTPISLTDLMPADRQASFDFLDYAPGDSDWISIPIVSQPSAIHDHHIVSRAVLDLLKLPADMLGDLRPNCRQPRKQWQRFVAVRATELQARPMQPVIQPHAILLIDRHYCSLMPHRITDPNIYAVRVANALAFRYLAFEASRLILRPYNLNHPIDLLELATNETLPDLIVGRVCLSLGPV